MTGIKFPACLHQLVIEDVEIFDGGVQVLMAQGLADKFQRPAVAPSRPCIVSAEHMGRQLDPGLLLHPAQHIVHAFHHHRLSCISACYVDEELGLILQQVSAFAHVMQEHLEGIAADYRLSFFRVLRTGVIFIIIPEIYAHSMLLIINIPCIIYSQDFSNAEAGFSKPQE